MLSDEEKKEFFLGLSWIPDVFTIQEITEALEADGVRVFNTLYKEQYGSELNAAQKFYLAVLGEEWLKEYGRIFGLEKMQHYDESTKKYDWHLLR